LVAVTTPLALVGAAIALIPTFPELTFRAPHVFAIGFIAYFFGRGPGIVTFILSVLGYIFISLLRQKQVPPFSAGNEIEYVIFIAVCLASLVAMTWVRSSQRRITERTTQLEEEIRDHKQAEEALRKSQYDLKTLTDSIPDVIDRYDRDFRHVYVSPSIEKATGIPAEQWIGKRNEELGLPEHLHSSWDAALQSALDTCEAQLIEFDFDTPTGPRRYHSRIVPEYGENGLIVSLLTVSRDITARNQAEEALRESEALLNRSQQIAHLGSWELDLLNNRLVWSDEVYRIFGLKPQEFGATYEAFLEAVHPDDRAAVDEAYSGSILEGRDTYQIEHRVVKKSDGEIRVVQERCEHIRDESGRIIRSIGMVHDITEQKQAQEEIAELLRREHLIAEMLQQAILPAEVPERVVGYRIATRYQPALEEAQVGGDFYDVFKLSQGRIGILIGDVAGKGLQAAIRVAEARYSVRSYAYLDPSPAKVMTLANAALAQEDFEEGNMLTAFFAVVDPADNTMTYACAGHEPPLVCDAHKGITELAVTGPMLGILQGVVYSQQTYDLSPGDVVLMFTDGITEARHDTSIFFDKSGVVEYLKRTCDTEPDKIAEALLNAATAHAGGSLQDDAAIVVLEVPSNGRGENG
jgi:PAS domain S-box-containing protein